MKCPDCGGELALKSPDYGRGAEFGCYSSQCMGRWGEKRFSSHSRGIDPEEAARVSRASLAQSAANAEEYRRRK